MVSNIFLLFLGKFVFNMVERDFWFCFWNLILMFFILIWKFNREMNYVSGIIIFDIIKILFFIDKVYIFDLEIIIFIILFLLVLILLKEENNFLI